MGALQLLDLWYCSVEGAIPSSLGNLTNLTSLYLSHNNLTGQIPGSLGQLLSLSVLDLSRNSLEGLIPLSYLSLGNLSILDILSSRIPSQLGDLSSLVDLDLSFNTLTGSLLEDLRGLRNLQSMIIGDNLLDGSLPDDLFATLMLVRDVVSWTSLITGNSQWGFVDEAFQVFELMPESNSVSWNAMIAAFVQSNRFHEAVRSFRAREVDTWVYRELDSKLATTIIDMCCKCGCLEKAFEVFNGLLHKGISSWNCMIGGLATHGKGEAAIQHFKEMEMEMVAPDNITFVNLLSACAHSGLVEEGCHYFRRMVEVHGIEPRIEHFGCMVDLLGRAGMLEEARKLIDEMPMSPDAGVLGAPLGACKIHGNIELGEQIGRRVIELEPNNSGRYALLANLYAKAGRWEDVANVRKLTNDG
ncbi:hypothetical protein FH972_018118 [Carpinus fangiana]|uniref:Disease resistance R13L4/SHOC-2-like LRR domain-containing protein n=1 Tax=Carpinus fangiana TaxID=176857 RepID=A0A5N6RMG0_9ROSI|nr:hypothetical protein FH972_018118 [Carpinus fangiana]